MFEGCHEVAQRCECNAGDNGVTRLVAQPIDPPRFKAALQEQDSRVRRHVSVDHLAELPCVTGNSARLPLETISHGQSVLRTRRVDRRVMRDVHAVPTDVI